ELAREREQDAALLAVIRLLGASLELEALLTEFGRIAAQRFNLTLAAAGLLDSTGISVKYGAIQLEDQTIQPFATQWLPLTTGLAGEAAHHRRTMIRSEAPFETLWRVPGAIGTQVALPLLSGGQVMGVLLAQSERLLAPSDIERLETVGEYLATAIVNANLYGAARERATSMTAINELAQAISSSLDLEQILNTALQQIRQLVPYDQASVSLYDTDQHQFVIAAANDAYTGELPGGQTFDAQGTPLRTAFEAGHPVYLADVSPDDRGTLPPPFGPETNALMIVPLYTGNSRLGTLNLASRTAHAFTDSQIGMLGGLSHFLTTALINGRLYTQRAEAIQRLEETRDHLLLVEKLRALGELAGGVTHDFNNLLAGILGNVQLLMTEVADPEQLRTLRVVEKAAKDGAETVKRIQGFARNDGEQPDAPVDLELLARDALDLTRVRWRNSAQERGVHIEMQRELNPVPLVRGHAAELREVVTNLIINAIDAMPEGGMIRVATGQRGAEVFLAVADSGIGMSEEVRARIFDPFFTTKGERGNGLGLSVSAAIVQRHGGRFEVQSIEGRGTNFTIWLPLLDIDFDEVMAHDDEVPGATGRVLLVEDEELVRTAVSRMLSAWGHRVVSADNGREALARFRPGAFDVVISDLGMPDMSGWDVLRQVRAAEPEIRTVLLTGWARQIDPADAKLRGVDVIIAKPFDQLTLRRTLGHMLEGTLDMTPRVIG
ncbi:MAG TPA: GAF domain-containing protein, partial [Herpetosiphonaceae bacterium]